MSDVSDKMVEAGAKALAEEQEKAAWENFNDVQKDRYRDEVRIVLAAALAAQWQDIESAERDGTPYLVRWAGRPYDPAIAHCEYGVWGYLGRDMSFTPFALRPTHCMAIRYLAHLPAPPATEDRT